MAKDTLDLGEWFILRCASADTLKMLDQLTKRGFDVWTPVQNKLGKRPRTRTTFEKRLAILPSYAFANVHHLPEIARLAMMPTADTVRFTLFRTQAGALPLLKDRQLDALRLREEKLQAEYEKAVRQGTPAPKLQAGYTKVLRGSGFDGLEATVIEQQGSYALVDIPGFSKPVKIASLLLMEDELRAEDEAAKAA